MSTSSNISLLAPQTFTGENFQVWAVKMQSYLEAFDLWEFVDEDKPVTPLPRDPTLAQIKAHTEEKTKRAKAKTIIQNSVGESVFPRIMACKTAKETWDTLKVEYQGSDRTRQMQVLNLKRNFEALSMKEEESISQYSDRISVIVNQIQMLGVDFPDSRVVEKVLVSLPERFESKISSLEESKDLTQILMAELMSALQAQEQRRSLRQGKVMEGALYAQNQQGNKGKKTFNKKSKVKNDSCDSKEKFAPCRYYKKTTHVEKYCWWRPDAMCGNCRQLGHITRVCKFKNKDPQSNQQTQAIEVEAEEEQLFVASCFHSSDIDNTWLIDSGCTNHMTFDSAIFKDLDKNYKTTVRIGNGDFLDVEGKGMAKVKTSTGIKLIADVLYVPKLSQNLLSVGQMMEKGYSLEFKDNNCTVFDNNGAKLFSVKMKKKSFIVEWNGVQAYAGAELNDSNLWRKRFDHFNHRSLTNLKRQDLVQNMSEITMESDDCETCQQKKQVKQLGNDIFICQKNYTVGILQKFHMADCKPVNTPMSTCKKLSKDIDTKKANEGLFRNLFSLGSDIFTWSSKKQETTAQSAAFAVNQAIWLRKLLMDLGCQQKGLTEVKCDNFSAVSISKNPVFYNRTKHIKIKFYFIREGQQSNEVILVHCSSEDQLADLLTKALSKERFEILRQRIGVCLENVKEEC